MIRRVRDKHGLLQLSKRAKAFHPGQGVYRSSYKNARRLTATENNIAYRTADYLRYQQMDFVVGIQICLSNNHTVLLQPGETTSDPTQQRADGSPKANAVKHLVDICDDLQGRYPKDFKFTGWHPHCRCHVITILKSKDEIKRDIKRLENGETVDNTSVNEVTELPKNFETWIKNNEERLKGRATLPYFITDNQRQVNGILGIKHYLCESKLDTSINKIRKSLVRQDREIMYVLNSKGQIISTIKGGKLSVEFEEETSKVLENTIITHNHPTGKGINGISQFGYSLSSQDVYEAILCNVKQMIAETQYYRYLIERPERGWRVNADDVKKRYAEIYKEIVKKYERSIIAHRAINYIQHIVMKQLAKEYEFIYRYENLKKN